MYPLRERPILWHSWEELLEAPLNSEGLHILQTIPAEEREMGYLQLPPQEENQASTLLRSHQLQASQASQGPFPLLPQHPDPQRQRNDNVPRHSSEIRGPNLSALELALNPEQTRFSPGVHHAFTGGKIFELAITPFINYI